MISVTFSVRPDQGSPSGFDLGDITITSQFGSVTSLGRTPDQGMMIYISVPQLLDSVGEFLRGKSRALPFIGTDTSFKLTVRRTKEGFSVAGDKGVIARTDGAELVSSLLQAAQPLARNLPADDAVHGDLERSLAKFGSLLPGSP